MKFAQDETQEPAHNRLALKYWSPWLAAFVATWVVLYSVLMPQPVQTFLTGYQFILVGFLGAVIGNITALGGGLVFIPVLIFGYHVPPLLALKTAIISQAFGMSSGALAWRQSTAIPGHILPWAIPGLVLGATLSSLVFHPSAYLVKGLFGPVSITLGCLLLLTVLRSKKVMVESWDSKVKCFVVFSSLLGGLITGWVAIGEGELVAAMLMLFFGYTSHRAISLGVCLLAICSIYLGTIHAFVLGGVPWEIAAFTLLGCVFGARMAPICARYLKPRALKVVFAVVAILDGILFMIQFFGA